LKIGQGIAEMMDFGLWGMNRGILKGDRRGYVEPALIGGIEPISGEGRRLRNSGTGLAGWGERIVSLSSGTLWN
jgi:hypothetical protein